MDYSDEELDRLLVGLALGNGGAKFSTIVRRTGLTQVEVLGALMWMVDNGRVSFDPETGVYSWADPEDER